MVLKDECYLETAVKAARFVKCHLTQEDGTLIRNAYRDTNGYVRMKHHSAQDT